jgi:hypothetical protein
MRVQSRVFWLPKDPGFAEEYEDAWAVDVERGRAAIADGVSSAIFSGVWARILTEAAINDPPDVLSPTFWDWLAERRREWSESIDPASLSFFQRGKLQQCGGAFATLLWLEWHEQNEALNWKCTALGDGGLLHVRDGQLLAAFPIAAADELFADPLTIASARRSGDRFLEFRSGEGQARAGDWFALASDAFLGWALRNYESGLPVDWTSLWELSDDGFAERVAAWRDQRAIRTDDTTLMLLQVTDDIVDAECEPGADPSDGYAD